MSNIEKSVKVLADKNYTLRIITPCYRGYEHVFLIKGKAEYIRCSYRDAAHRCILCDYRNRSTFYVFGAIDRADNQYSAFRISHTTYSGIVTYEKHQAWGDISQYDFEFIFSGTNEFGVRGRPKIPLSQQELEIVPDLEFLTQNVGGFPIDCVKSFIRRNGEHLGFSPEDICYLLKQK